MKDYSEIAGEAATRATKLVAEIKPLFAGRGGDVQGAALAELVALWLAGHPPKARALVWEHWTKLTLDLVPGEEAEMFKTRKRPEDWQ